MSEFGPRRAAGNKPEGRQPGASTESTQSTKHVVMYIFFSSHGREPVAELSSQFLDLTLSLTVGI